MILTVVFRNPSPMMFYNDPPSHRSAKIELTAEQVALLKPRHVGTANGKDIYESISQCFIEPKKGISDE